MKNYRIQKEPNHIENENNHFYIEAENIDEVKKYLKNNNLVFIRYSKFTDTIYYK